MAGGGVFQNPLLKTQNHCEKTKKKIFFSDRSYRNRKSHKIWGHFEAICLRADFQQGGVEHPPVPNRVNNNKKYCSVSSFLLQTSSSSQDEENEDQLKKQVDVNKQDIYGWSNLHWSTFRGQYAKCKELISAGADVNLPDEHGFTPLFVAARQGNFDISKLLLDSGADVQRRNYVGKTALDMATEKSFSNIEKLLKKYEGALE